MAGDRPRPDDDHRNFGEDFVVAVGGGVVGIVVGDRFQVGGLGRYELDVVFRI